ncbi:MAG TPA: hypothetical protein ENJ00_08185 [Phycisphaerales bacterium]|nr:hypothetical protein [Phycisphaerales bacterium]
MTTIQSQPGEQALGAPLRRGAIEWAIDRRTMVRARPDVFPESRSRRPVMLRVVFDRAASPVAELTDPATGRVHPIPLGEVRPSFVDEPMMTHVELCSPDHVLLSATIRTEGGQARLIYVRTTLLERLHVPGGRYRAPTFVSVPD